MDNTVKKWIVDMDRMIKVGFFYTNSQKMKLETRYINLNYNVTYDHDGWMIIESN